MKEYKEPVVEVIELPEEDIITSSNGSGYEDNRPDYEGNEGKLW